MSIHRRSQVDGKIKRRDFLKGAAAAMSLGTVSGCAKALAGRRSASWMADVAGYLESVRGADGGYGWWAGERSHLTPSYAAAGCYHLMGQEPPNKNTLAEYIRTHHPFRVKKLERDLRVFEYEQIQGLLWLGENADSFRGQVQGWTKPSAYPRQYERDGYPILRFEVMPVLCRGLLGLSTEDIAAQFIEYLDVRRRANGSFNNTPAGDGSDGHVMNTLWAVQALAVMGRPDEKQAETVAWLQACQRSGGGSTYQPKPAFAGIEDVTYTWAAVRALGLYGARPARRDACIEYILSLRNKDGGFADRAGWASNPPATYRALDALAALDGFESLCAGRGRRVRRRQTRGLPKDLKVFTIQIEAHGKGSPAEAAELAGALRIDLWGAKNAAPGWIAAAQAAADRRQAAVRFYAANEEYGTFVSVAGMGTYSHTSDVVAPANADFGPPLSGKEAVLWEDFRRRRLAPLEKGGGRLIWQFNENEELTRLYLDDSLERGGYAGISTFHFGNPDFTNSEPFLTPYGQKIPFVALQDAHGSEAWWWSDQLTGFRTLFLAKAPTWEGWLRALERNWVVAVRHDAVSGNETWIHGGLPEAVEFIRGRQEEWRWWDNPRIRRPMVSIVAVRPEDEWETARPERGVTVRVRCWRENTTQGLPKAPRVELVRLAVDGREVEASLVAPKAKWGAYEDYYHYYHIAEPAAGRHKATATVRSVDSGAESTHTIEFSV